MHWDLLLWKIDCSFWHIEWRVTCYIINTLLWKFCVCCRNEENLIELYSIISLNWSGRLLGSVTAWITNLVLQTALCWGGVYGMGSWWSVCCNAAALPHFTGWVNNHSHHRWSAGKNLLVFQSCIVSLKKWEHILSEGSFLVSLANKAHLSVRKHCCSILGTEYIWFLRHFVVAFLAPNTHE